VNAPSPTTAGGARWTWRQVSAVAAALVLGVLLGAPFISSSQPLPLMSDGGRVVAVAALETALDTLPTGKQGTDSMGTFVGMSFRGNTGGWCRSFATQRGPAGLACRERGDWVIEVLARNPRPRDGRAPDGYRQSGAPFPEAIRQAVVARQVGEALSAQDEAAAIAARWRN
jgi:hypothetical protein